MNMHGDAHYAHMIQRNTEHLNIINDLLKKDTVTFTFKIISFKYIIM